MDELREACAHVAARARHVGVDEGAIAGYAAALPLSAFAPGPADGDPLLPGSSSDPAAFWLTLNAVNFGSGWFPTLRKRPGRSGFWTIALGVQERFDRAGPWPAAALAEIEAAELATVVGQDPEHELIGLLAASLRDLGRHVAEEFGGSYAAVASQAGGSAVGLARMLGDWDCFADCSVYEEIRVPFLKRAQIAAADLARAGVIAAPDLRGLTMFADNLVPHVLRLDGILGLHPALVARIDREELIEHDSPEEIEIRACALHAVELIVAGRPGTCAADVDQLLWLRGRQPRYKASPRHRSRCTAY